MVDLDRSGARATFIAALLGATFLLTAFLALRAQFAAEYHRATAQKVVRDWSAVAADELARRTENYLSYNGTYPLLQALANETALPESPFALHTFRWTPQFIASDGTPEATRAWLAAHPPSADENIVVTIDGEEHAFAFLVAGGKAAGVEIDRGRIAPFIQRALLRPLLPRSLAEGRIGNDAILFRVRDAGGRVLVQQGGAFERLSMRRFEDDGLLRGFTVDAAIAPRVAPLLVIGGLPRSPFALYTGVLAVTALLLITAALQLRKERALARLRSDFVASVSHELRTPLTQIRMFAETLLLDRVRSEEERTRSLKVIDQETRRLSNVVENVLQFSRGERGTLRIAPQPCDVAAIVRETIDHFAPIAATRNVRVRLIAEDAVIVTADESAIRQIVLNLLDNAVKYGPAGGEVVIECTPQRITVEDEGPGIPLAARRRVFHRYYRLPRDREQAIAGAGIGLSVVRELVALHGGKVRIESAATSGARVIVELGSELPP